MAKKEKAKKGKSTKKAEASSVPSKITLGKKTAGNDDDKSLYQVTKCIQDMTKSTYVRRGQLTLFLTNVTRATESATEATDMIADAIDSGALAAA